MKSETFSGGIGAFLVLAGSAVGLGNIWRFPYMVAQNGGGAFILIYLLCILFLSLPVLLSEISIGRHCGNMNFHPSVNFLFVLIPTITLSYYCVIGGWTVKYFVDACCMSFDSSLSTTEIASRFGNFVSSPWKPLLYLSIFLPATGIIIAFGVRQGIEKFSRFVMPLLFVVMCLLAIRCMTLPAMDNTSLCAADGIRFLFKPDFSKVTAVTFVKALGQAFYSMSIGMGILVTFGSYLNKKNNLVKTAASTAAADFIFAIISASVVIPAMFAYGMFIKDPMSGEIIANPEIDAVGAGLIYKTLPVVFSQMPFGNFVAIFFFLAVILAAITSSISLFEVPVSYLMNRHGFSRAKACISVFIICFSIGCVCSLSFGPLSNISIRNLNIFDMLDWGTANILMPLAGFICTIIAGWMIKKADLRNEISNSSSLKGINKAWPLIYTLIRYVAPVGVLAVAMSGLLGI